MPRNTFMFTLIAAVSLVMAGLANAASTAINVDFNVSGTYPNTPAGTYVGLGAAPDVVTNTFWNGVVIGSGGGHIGPFTSGVLTASDSTTVTTATFTLNNYSTLNGKGQYSSLGTYTTTFAEDLFGDLAYNNGSPTYSISGLDAGAPYDLYLYSMMGYPNSDNTVFTVNGIAGSTTITGLPSVYGSAFASVPAGTSGGGNYVLYSHVIATGGTISGTFSGTNIRFNGFQLVEAPEPASLGLLLAGGVMLLRRRRA